MNDTAKIAIDYKKRYGFSVIPITPSNKEPWIFWEKHQSRFATDKEIEQWWEDRPNSMVGVVTGKLSGIDVVDVDGTEAPRELKDILGDSLDRIPSTRTPRGGQHLFFKHREGVRNRTNVWNVEGDKTKVDIRGEGGFAVLPPSCNGVGKKYKWILSLENEHPDFPEELLSIVNDRDKKGKPKIRDISFSEGSRNENIFHACNSFRRGGMPQEEAEPIILQLASSCNPPFPAREALASLESAYKRALKGDTKEIKNQVEASENLSQKIRDYVEFSTATFSLGQICNQFNLVSVEDKGNARVILHRLKEQGVIEPDSRVNGRYRKVDKKLEVMDWVSATTTPYDVALPFNLREFANLYSKNIVVIAGNKGSGKTATLLKFALDNADKHKIYYAVSDMGKEELKVRIQLFEKEYGIKARDTFKKVIFFERVKDYADVIQPNDITVIDYMEVVENFYDVGRSILNIWKNLNKGMAIVALQKSKFKDLGRGGDFTLEKARLYLSLTHDVNDKDGNTCKIIACKNYKTSLNPHGLIQKFKIVSGTKIIPVGTWHHQEDEEIAGKASGKRW